MKHAPIILDLLLAGAGEPGPPGGFYIEPAGGAYFAESGGRGAAVIVSGYGPSGMASAPISRAAEARVTARSGSME